MMKPRHVLYPLMLSLLAATSAHAQPKDAGQEAVEAESPQPYGDKVLGDLGGQRTKLANAGVELELNYSGDVWAVLGGGKKRIATYLDFIELRTNLDGEKLFGIPGNTISVSVIDNNGTRSNGSTVGSTQGIDNSEVASNGVRLYEAWMQQNFMGDRLSFLVGMHDLNTEFSATPISDNFLTPTMQTGQSFAQSGANGPSIYPTTSLAGRVKYKPTEESYIAAALYDGVPGNPKTTTGSTVHLGKKDGLLEIAEIGVTPKAAGTDDAVNKLAFGVWNYTGGLANIENPAVQDTAQGFYVLSSYRFYHDAASGRSLGAFLRGGGSDGDTAQVDWDYETGIVANGWVPTRPDSEIGFGVSGAHNGDAYMRAQAAAATPTTRNETNVELYYRDTVARGVTVQPDLHYIVNPGTDPTLNNAWVAGLRLDVAF